MIAADIPHLLAVAVIFLAAGMVKGVTGMGLPTIAMGLLGSFMAPPAAAALLVVPSFVTNVWQLAAGPSFRRLARRLWPMMLGIVVGTVAGAGALTGGATRWTAAALGAALIAYALVGLGTWTWRVGPAAERWLALLVGLATGLVTGATGVFVIPAVPYLQSLGLDRDDLVQALGLSFTVSTLALALGLAQGGALATGSLLASAMALAPAVVGMVLGQRIRGMISAATFRRWFLVCLAGLGVQLVLRAVF